MYAFVCDRCKLPRPTGTPSKSKGNRWNFLRARSAFSYEDPITNLVLRLKYNAEGDIAKFVAPFLAEVVKEVDVLIPVPLAPKRFKERGYNQADLITIELSMLINVPVVDSFLIRVKHTNAQKKMSLKERKENLHNAFKICPPYSAVKGKRVLLIDDVFTTGSTVDECARVMKKAKPKSIEVLTIASVSQ